MILSVHIPKTAGTSFLVYLQEAFGSRLRLDYGDVPELQRPEDLDRRQSRQLELVARAAEIERDADIIHGHYLPAKYQGLFAETRYITFLRDPYQHAVSTYMHAARNTDISPGMNFFRQNNMDMIDIVRMFPDHQTFYLSGKPMDEFTLIGVTEQFDLSMSLFRKIFAVPTPWNGACQNVNPNRSAVEYEIPDDLRRAVDRYREQDIALYQKAKENLIKLAKLHNIS